MTSPPTQNKLVVQQALRVKRAEAPFPLLDPDSPVSLRILYDGEPVPIDVQDGRAYVREPNEGERVTFELSHQGPDDATYGVVLKVNGQNSLYRQWWRTSECAKWVLAPGSEPIVIRGFQETAGKLSEFRVLSPAESRAGEVRYGKDTGQISLAVFRQRTGPTPTPELLDDGAEDLMAITRGTYPEGQADNLFALKSRLLAGTVMPVRGLIEGGDQRASARTEIPFEADPTPVLSATITYYSPQE